MKPILPLPGDVFEHAYPFYIDDSQLMECHWRPGAEPRGEEFDLFPDPEMEFTLGLINDPPRVADAMGTQILTVVAIYKPPGYMTRVFYTRKWRDPDGKEFGKRKLRVAGLAAWRKLLDGYRHPFEMRRKAIAK